MNIVILGQGNMGTPLAKLAVAAGHSVVTLTSSDSPEQALQTADLVILAMQYQQALDFAATPGISATLTGKVVVDITNPLAPDFMSLTVGHTTSAAEEIAKRLPNAKIVKAFNTVFASILALHAAGDITTIPVFVAGDDATAKATTGELARSFGFTVINAGALSNARYLEPMTEMMIHLGYGLGHGDKIGFALVKAV
ncbi:hypothetical protein SB11R_08000 [Pseudomonas oryzihabitans]|nr:hypothetical protein SB11R_08000 [Pseudomonas psychrotolerans]KTT65002.1 hypothetical protein NS383_13130 [Pseudomonas psychrotolerans]